MTTDPFTLVLTVYLIMAAVMVGLRCHGSEHVWMAPDLDRIGGDWMGAAESDGHSLEGATALASRGVDYRDYQRTTNAYSHGSLELTVNAENMGYRDPASTNSQRSLSLT